jgi:hypothetical protein
MQPDRLPAQLVRRDWGKNPAVSGRARPKLHTDVTSAIAAKLGHDPATAAATLELSAGARPPVLDQLIARMPVVGPARALPFFSRPGAWRAQSPLQ